jgi:hypothetical protein
LPAETARTAARDLRLLIWSTCGNLIIRVAEVFVRESRKDFLIFVVFLFLTAYNLQQEAAQWL